MSRAFISLLAALALSPIATPALPQSEEGPSAEERFEDLEEKALEVHRAWQEAVRKARQAAEAGTEAGVIPAIPMRPDFSALVPEFEAAARDFAGTEGAPPFLLWLVENGGAASGKEALRTLLREHAASEQLVDSAGVLRSVLTRLGDEEGLALLEHVEETSPHAAVRAWAAFARLAPVLEANELGSEAYEAAKAELAKKLEGVEDRTLRSEFGQLTVLRETFGLGMVAPDISGVDLDGTAFRLGDYAGQVVFLDFWGDW